MNDVCSIELLTNAVANRLTADEETALYDHLERCEACCARMEQLAGGEQWQQEAAALLTTDELDAAVPEPMVWSEVDFSVEHLEPSEDANVLGQLGGYDVLAIIGRGGMGVVLKAFDRELKRFVAIKALSPHLAHSSVARKRFAREAQAAAAVVNPHVIAIHHVQPTGRLPFLIMPLLTGESLAQRLKSRAPLELTEVLRIGMQAAAGLAAAHDQGLVHRDVKPANIFLEKGVERVVITDFGLARAADDVSMTRLGVVAGTPEYMSPEQARGEALDGRSDLFSLGCVLYEMATGVSPFRSDSTIATLRRIVDDKPAATASLAPELPPWFSHIVERLLSKDPAQRLTSANEVALLLEQCLSHLQQPTSVPLPVSLVPYATSGRSVFNVTRLGVMTMLGTIGMTLLGMVLWQATDPPDISGQWASDEWGTVVLEAKGPGEYEGTFTGTGKDKPAPHNDPPSGSSGPQDFRDAPKLGADASGSDQDKAVISDSKTYSRVYVRDGALMSDFINADGRKGVKVLDPEFKDKTRVVRETQSDNQIVFAPDDAAVHEVRVENGQAVKKGEVLLVLRRDSPLHQDQVESLYIPSKIDGVVVIFHGKQNLLDRLVRRGDRLLEIRPIASGAPSQGEFQHLSGFPFNGADTTSGTLHLKWSRLERRFNGSWGKGDDRNGKLSVRLVDNEIRGGWTTNKGSQKESSSPRLADLTWRRSVVAVPDDVYGEHKTYEDPNSGAQYSNKKLPKTVTLYVRSADYQGGPFDLGDYVDVYQTRRNYDHEPWREWCFFKNVKIFSITEFVDTSIENGSAWSFEVSLGAESYVTDVDMATMLPLYEKAMKQGKMRWIVRPAKSKQNGSPAIIVPLEHSSADSKGGGDLAAGIPKGSSSQASIDDKAPELVETPQPPTASDPDTNRSRDLNGFLIAWDFNYPLLGKRMAKLRVSTDMNLESVFPGRPSVTGKAPKEDVKELVELIAAQVDWVGDIGAEYESTVSSIAEFERVDTSVRTERVAINLKGKVRELQLDKSEHLEIVNRLWRLEGIVAIGGKEGLTELLAVVGQKLSNQFPEVRYKLSSGDFRFGFKDEMGTRIAYFRIPPDRNRQEMNFTLTVPPTGDPKFELDENSKDEPTRNEDPPPKPNGDARSTDSSKIYTVEEFIANGMELSSKQLPITVRVKVVSVRQEGTVNADGTRAQHWCLSSKEYNGGLDPSALKIRVSENVEKALERNGVTDIVAHFIGKELTITGKLSNSGLRLPGRDTIWLFNISLDSLEQLILPIAETEDSNDEPTKNEDPPPQPHGDTRSPDSPKLYTAEEIIANGMKLINKQQPVTVRVKVVSVRREGTVNVDGTKVQHWWLSSKEYNGGNDPSALKIRVSENVEKALERNGL